MIQGPGAGKPTKVNKFKLQSRWKSWFPSELERREAARFAGLTWQEFEALPGTIEVAALLGEPDSKCAVIAHYRMSKLFEAVLADLAKKHPEPRPPGKGKRGRR